MTWLTTPETTLGYALALAIVSGIGWMVAQAVTTRIDRRRQRLVWLLEFTARQLEELYGPLAFLVTEGEQVWEDLLANLGRDYVFPEKGTLSAEDLSTWMFWAETEFMPRNRNIHALLAAKPHLIEG